MGINTARDEWVYDYDRIGLELKILYFAEVYEDIRKKLARNPQNHTNLVTSIKWDRELAKYLARNIPIDYSSEHIAQCLYRPFTKKHLYFLRELNAMQYQMPQIFPKNESKENSVIGFTRIGSNSSFHVLATDVLLDQHLTGDSQCLPLYRYTAEGERVCNITDWGLRQFNDHYRHEWGDAFPELAGPEGITAEDIFAYTYAVLHNPSYREEYRVDLLREFPRLPFYPDFPLWRDMGQALLDLHIGFEDAEPFPLERVDLEGDPRRVILRADREKGAILLDDKTTLSGVPPEAWEYQLGSRTALEWVLDQYKERKPRDPTIAEKFNTYRFADYKERVIDLLQRVCTVSVKTVAIVERMASLDHEKARP